MPAWTVEVDGTPEPNQYYVEIKDTANPFGDVAVVSIHDRDGQRFDAYEPGTPIDIFIYPEGTEDTLLIQSGETFTVESSTTDTFGRDVQEGELLVGGQLNLGVEEERVNRFTGFVADRDEREENGNDLLDVTVHTFDQLLRGEVIREDLSGQTISSALNTIVTEYTPVTWDASNVSVTDDVELTQSFRGEKVENALLELSFKSAAEGFGVNQDLEFFFRPIEASPAPRDVGPAEIFDVEIEEDGRAAPNEVTVFYDSGTQSVTVDRGDEKLQRQDQLGTDRPVNKAVELSRDDIELLEDARDVGERYLEERAAAFRGVVTTFDLFAAEVGDVINVRSVTKDLDDDYRVAAIEYIDTAETRVTIVDQRKDQDERLVNLGDSVDRIATRNADRDAVRNRVTNTAVRCLLPVQATAGGTTVDGVQTRFTNTGRTKIRDAWVDGSSTIDITEIAVGSDSTNLNRTNTALESETERVSVSQSLPDAQSVKYDGALSQNRNVSEIGLFDAAGDLIVRATFDPFVQTDTVSARIDAENDPDIAKAVVTNGGLTAIRDIVADNAPDYPTQYAYGSDGTDPAITDTALGNELAKQDLAAVSIQSADLNTEWSNITSLGANDPFQIANDELQLAQSAFVQEGEDGTTAGGTGFVTGSQYSDGTAETLADGGDSIEWDFTLDYTIPESAVEIAIRIEGEPFPDFTVSLDGSTAFTIDATGGDILLGWNNVTGGDLGSSDWSGGDLSSGSHTLRIEQDAASNALNVDVVAVYDGRFSYTFDETTDSNGYLSGPQLFPNAAETSLDTATTAFAVADVTFESTWNDVSGTQYIEVSNDGSTFIRSDNTQNGGASFSSAQTDIDTNFGFSRYGTQTTATPTDGYLGQAVDDWELFANPGGITPSDIDATNTRTIIPPDTVSGVTFREGGQLAADDTLLTRSVFAGFDVNSNIRVVASEETRWSNTT